MADKDLRAELERLRAENEQLKNKGMRGLSLKVSEKGGLSLYGVGRFPVILYKEQWRKILGMAGEIEEVIKDNENLLKTKEKGLGHPAVSARYTTRAGSASR